MDKPWKVVLAFVGVFIAGAIFGAFFALRTETGWRKQGMVATPPPPAPTAPSAPAPGGQAPAQALAGRIAPQVMRQLTQRLNLSAEQRERIRPIVGRAGEDLQRLQREYLADTTRTTERMYADVAAILTPEQRVQLERMRQEMLDRVQREREKRGETPAGGTKGSAPGGGTRPPPVPGKADKEAKSSS